MDRDWKQYRPCTLSGVVRGYEVTSVLQRLRIRPQYAGRGVCALRLGELGLAMYSFNHLHEKAVSTDSYEATMAGENKV